MENKFELNINNLQSHVADKRFVIICLYLMLFSYFYNLPVLKYSLTGDNEFRLFDVVGFFLVYVVYANKTMLLEVINYFVFFKRLFYFLVWATFTVFFTFVYSLAVGNLIWGIQSVLYLFHFWSFFITAVFIFIFIQDLKFLKKIVNFTLIISCITFFIVILQNFSLIPFLWSDVYKIGYHNFLSGTLGPNKIVLGMTCLLVLIFSIGLLNEKRVKLNSILLTITISLSIIALIFSGSRTTYVGLIVFAVFYFFKDFYKFIISVFLVFLVFTAISLINQEIYNKMVDVYEYRVENKVKDKNALKQVKIDELYEDLGSGRKELSIMYFESLLDNAFVIPFGAGFNNRLINAESSAHNIYLSLISETGLVGLYFYLAWLIGFLKIKLHGFKQLQVALQGLVFSMLITLLFGEHIYVYRTSFGLTGLFLFITVIFLSPLHFLKVNKLNIN